MYNVYLCQQTLAAHLYFVANGETLICSHTVKELGLNLVVRVVYRTHWLNKAMSSLL